MKYEGIFEKKQMVIAVEWMLTGAVTARRTAERFCGRVTAVAEVTTNLAFVLLFLTVKSFCDNNMTPNIVQLSTFTITIKQNFDYT